MNPIASRLAPTGGRLRMQNEYPPPAQCGSEPARDEARKNSPALPLVAPWIQGQKRRSQFSGALWVSPHLHRHFSDSFFA